MKHPSQHKSNLITAPSEGETGAIVSASPFLHLSEVLKLYRAASASSQEFSPISFPKFVPLSGCAETLRGLAGASAATPLRMNPTPNAAGHLRFADRATPHGFRRSAATLFHHGAHAGDSVARTDAGSEDQKL